MILNGIMGIRDQLFLWLLIFLCLGLLVFLAWKEFGPKEFDEETHIWASNNDIYKLPKEERIRQMRIFQEYNRLRKQQNIEIMEEYIKEHSSSQDSQNASSAPPSKSEQP